MRVKTTYGIYKDCWLEVGKYAYDSGPAITICNGEDGAVARITVCIKHAGTMDESSSFVDTNNCPWAEDFIAEYELGEFANAYQQSGFCTYPLYKFDMEQVWRYTRWGK